MFDFSIHPGDWRTVAILVMWLIAILSAWSAAAHLYHDSHGFTRKVESKVETFSWMAFLLFGPLVVYLALLDLAC